MQQTTEELRAALGEAQGDKNRLTQRLEALQRTVDRNPLCRGCEKWRRSIAMLAGTGWFVFLILIFHKLALKDPGRVGKARFLAPEFQLLAQAIMSGKPDKLAIIFGGLLGPYLGVLAHWNWVLFRHGQPCMARRVHRAFQLLWLRRTARSSSHDLRG